MPTFRGTGTPGTLMVEHCEIFTTIVGSNAFNSQRIALIPNNFVWLNSVATCFSRFRWKRIQMEYMTQSPTSQGGQVALGATYDGGEQVPAAAVAEVAAMAHSQLIPTWMPGLNRTVTYDCSRWSKPWYEYLQLDDIPTKFELNSYTPGYLNVGWQTQVNGQRVGDILCHYTIEFLDPIPTRLQTQIPQNILRQQLHPDPEPEDDPQRLLASALRAISLRLAPGEEEESFEEPLSLEQRKSSPTS